MHGDWTLARRGRVGRSIGKVVPSRRAQRPRRDHGDDFHRRGTARLRTPTCTLRLDAGDWLGVRLLATINAAGLAQDIAEEAGQRPMAGHGHHVRGHRLSRLRARLDVFLSHRCEFAPVAPLGAVPARAMRPVRCPITCAGASIISSVIGAGRLHTYNGERYESLKVIAFHLRYRRWHRERDGDHEAEAIERKSKKRQLRYACKDRVELASTKGRGADGFTPLSWPTRDRPRMLQRQQASSVRHRTYIRKAVGDNVFMALAKRVVGRSASSHERPQARR